MITKQISYKIHSTKGESISEVLVALIVATLGVLMTSGAIISSTNSITKADQKMKEYYNALNKAEELTGTQEAGAYNATLQDSENNKLFTSISETPISVYKKGDIEIYKVN